jgi:hypothetical protein
MKVGSASQSPIVVAWGGGTNSTAAIVGLWERNVRPDLILFADTGGEKPETYEYIAVFKGWLGRHSFPDLHVIQKDSMYESLEDNCLQKHMLPSLAYGLRSCSDKWKRQPQDKFVNHWEPAVECWQNGEKVTKIIGYDASEIRRARIPEDAKYRYWYPLIEWKWRREDCEAAILRGGLPLPMKSACFFCPASKKHEIHWLRGKHPDLFERAVNMERAAKENLVTVKGLGRHWSWEEFAAATTEHAEDMPEVLEQPCTCRDAAED